MLERPKVDALQRIEDTIAEISEEAEVGHIFIRNGRGHDLCINLDHLTAPVLNGLNEAIRKEAWAGPADPEKPDDFSFGTRKLNPQAKRNGVGGVGIAIRDRATARAHGINPEKHRSLQPHEKEDDQI